MNLDQKIIWPNNQSIDPDILADRIKFVEKNMWGLLPVYNPEYSALKTYVKVHDIKMGQLLSIRNQLKIKKEIKRNKLVDTYAENIIRAFDKLISKPDLDLDRINAFYARTNLPIHSVIKLISQQSKFKELDHHLIKKFYQVLKDINKIETKSKIQSEKFESHVEKFITNLEIRYQTEADIRYEKIYKVTPDILFDEPVTIIINESEHKIRWLDAKNYIFMGPNVPFILESIKKQAKKYNDIFGPGAFIFRYGFISGVQIEGAYLLDGSSL